MKFYAILPMICLAVLIGCDLSSVDPGGGATSPTSVTMRGAPPEIGNAGTTGTGDGTDGGATGIDLTVDPGTLVGQIAFDGSFEPLPPTQSVAAIKIAVCAKNGDIPDESLIVNPENNGVKNVFVYLSKRPDWLDEKSEWDPDVEQQFIDQKFCVFKPHALIARVGPFKMKNSDEVPHNVKSGFPSINFNPNLPPNSEGEVVFKRAEKQPYPCACAIHGWMSFYTLVVDHPYAAVTDENGNFSIPNLPAGTHTFRIWHERGGTLDRKFTVTVPSGGDTEPQVRKFAGSKFKL